MSRDPLIGKLIDNRIRLIRLLGEGGMGSVYEGENVRIGRRCAIKVLSVELSARPDAVKRFEREARASSRVEHPNIIAVSDLGRLENGRPYLVMEFVDGRRLDLVIRDEGPMPWDRGLPVLIQVADAVGFAHERGVVHRDIKPENILLVDQRGAKDFVKVVDFGLARIVERQEWDQVQTMHGAVFGTPEYMAPEQTRGERADTRSDVYALGVLMYELLTARAPFTGPSVLVMEGHQSQPPPPLPPGLPKPVPKGIEAVMYRCLQKERDARYQNGREVREALAQVRVELRNPGLPEETKRASGVVPVAAPGTAIQTPGDGGRDVSIRPMRAQLAVTEARLEARDVTTDVLRKEQRFRIAAQSLAEALVDSGTAGSDISMLLAKISEGDEDVVRRATDYALVDSHGEELEQAMREREGMLRSAIVDLRLAERQTRDASKVNELSRQAEVLERKLGELSIERLDIHKRRDSDRTSQRDLLVRAERTLADRYFDLERTIETARSKAKLPRLLELYSLYDACRRELA